MSPTDKSRGAMGNVQHRYARTVVETIDDGWWREPGDPPPRETRLHDEAARSIVSHNQSPDVPFARSINPIAGCEHGCIYCYARPSHAFRDLSPGLDFETELFVKRDAARLLREELGKPGYQAETICIGANTDPYQPAERQLGLTRELLQVFIDHRHPVSLITKGGGILRDLDLLTELAGMNLVQVMVSITTLDKDLKRRMEPRTASPALRLRAVAELKQAGVPVGVLMSPVIPFINDEEIEAVVTAAAEAGASEIGYALLRLPHELVEIFEDWLEQHYPQRRQRIMNRIRDMRGGQNYDSRFGVRMRGQGPLAQLIKQRFDRARRAAGLNRRISPVLRTDLFRVPGRPQQRGFDF